MGLFVFFPPGRKCPSLRRRLRIIAFPSGPPTTRRLFNPPGSPCSEHSGRTHKSTADLIRLQWGCGGKPFILNPENTEWCRPSGGGGGGTRALKRCGLVFVSKRLYSPHSSAAFPAMPRGAANLLKCAVKTLLINRIHPPPPLAPRPPSLEEW